MPTKMIGNIPAISNFSSTAFQTKDWGPEAKINAILTTGGGNAIPQVFDELVEGHENLPPDVRESVHDPKYLKDKRTKTYKNLWRKYDINKRFFLDDILEQMRAKHGDNFNLKWLTGYKPDDEGWPLNEKLIEQLEEHLKTPEGQKRFKGLELQHRLPPTEMPNAFSNAHYIYLTPGSTSAEIMSMPGEHVPKVISVLPNDKPARYMKHFPINARELEEKFHGAKTWDTMGENRGEALRRILEEEHSPAVGRNTGYKTDTAGIGETIKKDIRANKIKNMKGLLAGAGLSLSALGAAKVLRIIKKHKEQREKEQNMAKISMLSEEFKKTTVKNKNNTKTAFMNPGAVNTAMNVIGGGLGASHIAGAGYNTLQGDLGGAMHQAGDAANTFRYTPYITNSLLANSPKILGGLSAFGAPFAAANAFGNIKDFGDDWTKGNVGGLAYDTGMGALNSAMAYGGGKQAINSYKLMTAGNPFVQSPLGNGISSGGIRNSPLFQSAMKSFGNDANTFVNGIRNASAPRFNQFMEAAPRFINNASVQTGNFINNGLRNMGADLSEFNSGIRGIAGAVGESPLVQQGINYGNRAIQAGGRALQSGMDMAGKGISRAVAAAPGIAQNTSRVMGGAAEALSPTMKVVAPAAANAGLSLGTKAIPIVGDIAQGYMSGYTGGHHSLGRAVTGGIGSLLGRIGGGTAGTFALPGAGTLIGEVGGSIAGTAGSTALYDKIFGGNTPTKPTATAPQNQPAANPEHFNNLVESKGMPAGEGQKNSIPALGQPNTPIVPAKPAFQPSEAMGGKSTANVIKMSSEVKTNNLKRRNTGIGDWVNPKDFEYLSKSAAFNIISPEEYADLPLHPKVESIHEFFFPQG
jgi:hypothetical protein